MALSNTPATYGAVARSLHWLTALLILTAIPLGLYANDLPYDTGEALAWKAQVFSLHKTIGVGAFFVALARILWAVTQTHPAPLHPERRLETRVAEVVHWTLYLSLVIVPLSGWIQHAATDGFAPILWPFGQNLPLVPKAEAVAGLAGSAHWVFTKVLAASVVLHIAGALKHHLIDRDATLARMLRGTPAPGAPGPHRRSRTPLVAAFAVYAAGAALAFALTGPAPEAPAAAPAQASTTGNWQVTEGTLSFAVKQMGQSVEGSFADWTAAITFDETPTDGRNGTVAVTIRTDSLSLGAVTPKAKEAEFFDVATFPEAVFTADITPDGATYIATGTLTLRGVTAPVALPFTLTIEGDTARMTGETSLDRRAFTMGQTYADEAMVGFDVTVKVALTATRK